MQLPSPRHGQKSRDLNCFAPLWTAKRGRPTGLLLLSEVALGESVEHTAAKYIKRLPEGKLSCKGLGRTAPDPSSTATTASGAVVPLGKPSQSDVQESSLLYNEYIVYDTAQISTKYLCQVKFVFK